MKDALKRLFGEELSQLILLNLLTAALCLPVVTAGAAVLALNGTLVKILDDRCQNSRIREFWSLFKEKFWPGVALETLVVGYAAMLIWCASLAEKLSSGGGAVLALVMLAGFLAAIVSVCLALILASVRLPFGEALWNAVCMALGRLPRAALAAVFVYGLGYAAILFYPISLLLYVVIMLSVMAALGLGALWPALEELVLKPRGTGTGK